MAGIAIYARKSSESEDRQILSIDSQVNELRQLAAQEGLHVARVFTESMSAKAPGRPIFNELYSLLQEGKLDGIVCWKLDRLARNPVDGGALIWAMEENKLRQLVTPQRSFANTGNDKFWMQLEFGMAKKYVDDLSDNVKRGIRARLQQGWISGLPPLGYLNDRNSRTIIKDPDRFPLVRQMWHLMLKGNMTPPRILRYANQEWGLRTRKFKRLGDAPLALSAVYKILRHPFYYGMLQHNGEYLPGAHEPMITKAEFDRVQVLLGNRSAPRPVKHDFAFTGLMRCGECGASITAEHKKNRQGHRYVYYHCTRRKGELKCHQKVIEVRELEAQISTFLSSISIHPDFAQWVIKMAKELQDEEAGKDIAVKAALDKRYAACRNELSKLVDLRLRGLLNDDEYLAKKRELEDERLNIEQLQRNVGGENNKILDNSIDVFEFATIAKQTFDNGENSVKRACVTYLISNLSLRDRILNIEAQKPFTFVKRTLGSFPTNTNFLEPASFGDRMQATSPSELVQKKWCALIHDVRTFYLNNPSIPTFKELLEKGKEAGVCRRKKVMKERASAVQNLQ